MSSTMHPQQPAVLSAGYVPRGTVADEIGATGRSATTRAAVTAGAHGFVAELPEGYATPVGPGGVPLTDAQRLRLSIAALLVLDPAELVLEDPTAGLDVAGELAALPGLEALFRGRAVRVHRASPAVRAVAARACRWSEGGPALSAVPEPPCSPGREAVPVDPALPTLGLLLDPSLMARVLTGDSSGSLGVRVLSVRYKPGTNVTVRYAVDTGRRWSVAVAFASTSPRLSTQPRGRKLRRAVDYARKATPVEEPLRYVPEVRALVQWLPLDPRLPLVGHRTKKLNRRLVKAGLAPVHDKRPTLLRYWPRRRAVVRFGPYVLKTYREVADFRQAERGLRIAGQLRTVRTPHFLGVLPGRTTVQERVRGAGPSWQPAACSPAGSLLGALHGESVAGLRPTGPDDLLAKSRTRTDLLGRLLPALRPDLADLLDTLATRAPEAAQVVTSHGNYHAGQVLETRRGLVILDLDRMCLASRAFDLACFAAQYALGHPDDDSVVGAALESLLAGYGEAPADLPWYLSVCLLRRAQAPFRHQDEHWPDATARLVTAARGALA